MYSERQRVDWWMVAFSKMICKFQTINSLSTLFRLSVQWLENLRFSISSRARRENLLLLQSPMYVHASNNYPRGRFRRFRLFSNSPELMVAQQHVALKRLFLSSPNKFPKRFFFCSQLHYSEAKLLLCIYYARRLIVAFPLELEETRPWSRKMRLLGRMESLNCFRSWAERRERRRGFVTLYCTYLMSQLTLCEQLDCMNFLITDVQAVLLLLE